MFIIQNTRKDKTLTSIRSRRQI